MRGDFSDVVDFRNELTVKCTGNNISSPRRVVQCYLKDLSGTLKSTFIEIAFLMDMKWNPLSGE